MKDKISYINLSGIGHFPVKWLMLNYLELNVTIKISTRPEIFLAKGEIVNFDGFMKVYGRKGEDVILPEFTLKSRTKS